ncbi:hypothetical protein AB205_0040660, partial [Aquarana catesbeiana]
MESDDSRPPWLADVMAAIATCQSTLTTKIEAVQLDMGLIRQDIDKIRSRVTETEQRLSTTEDTIAEHGASLHTLQTKVKALEYKAEDAENRNRQGLLRDLLPEARWSPYFTVERAHRIPPKPGPPGSPPRTFILHLLSFRDRDEVLCTSRNVGDLRFQNTKLMIFPDYSVETQKLRKSFDQVKAVLRSRSIRYSVLFPARLRVQDGETTRFFTTPREASAWLDS